MRSRESNIPDEVNYVDNGSHKWDTAWGIAVTGVQIYNAIGGEGTDPFYPAKYGKVKFADDGEGVEKVDQCLAHPMQLGIFHYHTPSPCVANREHYESMLGWGYKGDIVERLEEAYSTANGWGYRTPIGISKDGRPMYSMFYNNEQQYDPCEVDVCNGLEIDGHYSYVSTLFHPFFMGCYGPGKFSDYA